MVMNGMLLLLQHVAGGLLIYDLYRLVQCIIVSSTEPIPSFEERVQYTIVSSTESST
jgi:hypothetical protein